MKRVFPLIRRILLYSAWFNPGGCLFLRREQVEAMREKIRILEGIWGDGASGGEAEQAAGPPSRGDRRQGGAAVKRGTGDGVDHPDSEEAGTGAETTAAAREGGLGGERSRHSDRPRKDSSGGGGGEGERGDVGASEAGGAGVDGGKAEAREGGEGDAGVDAWLISYNRRLKSELERLREKTRQAEDRWDGVVCSDPALIVG